MQFPQGEGQIDVVKKIRMIEWLKAELVGSVASLLKSMVKGGEERILDYLAAILITTYILGKRVGITFARIDQHLKEKLAAGIDEEHEIEEWYGDMSSLLRYMEGKKR
ncbi:MAG: hypothetical protein GX318_03110 [Clostridia bacterium]|nr:hypothetical protein [Clostridia bacterium]